MIYEKDGIKLEAANEIQASAFVNSGFAPVEEAPNAEAPKPRRGRKPKAEAEAAEA